MSDTKVLWTPHIVGPTSSFFTVSGYDATTNAWIAKVTLQNGGTDPTDSARKTLVNNLIVNLKNHLSLSSLSSLFDGIYIHAFADQNNNEALVDVVNTNVASIVLGGGTGTLDANGWKGDGAKSFINSGIAPGTNFTQNSNMIAVAILNDLDQESAQIGENKGGNESYIIARNLNNSNFELDGASYPVAASASSKGFWLASRTTNLKIDLYKDANTTPVSGSGADSSNPPSTAINFAIGAEMLTTTGSARYFSSHQIVASLIGAGVTSAQMAIIANDINTCLAGLPVPKNVF